MPIERNNHDSVDGTKISSISPNRKLSKKNSTGVIGVAKTIEKSPYRAYIILKGKKIELGRFKTLDKAAAARKEAEKKYFEPILKDHPSKDKSTSYVNDGKTLNLAGKVFPNFKVIKYVGMTSDKLHRWLCECECGKSFIATSSNIRNHRAQSCGCVKEEIPKITKPVIQCHCIMADGTNLTVIAKKEPNKNNKSGTKGIYQDRCGTWYAKIVFKGVEHRVKCTSQLQAIYKRKEMEMEYFDPVVKEHKKLLQKKKTKKGK